MRYVHHICAEYYTGNAASCCQTAPAAAPTVLEVTRTKQSCAVAAAAVVVRQRVPDDAICSRGLLHLIPVFLFLYSGTIHMNVSLGSAVACTASICL